MSQQEFELQHAAQLLAKGPLEVPHTPIPSNSNLVHSPLPTNPFAPVTSAFRLLTL